MEPPEQLEPSQAAGATEPDPAPAERRARRARWQPPRDPLFVAFSVACGIVAAWLGWRRRRVPADAAIGR